MLADVLIRDPQAGEIHRGEGTPVRERVLTVGLVVFALRESGRDLGDVLQARRALRQIADESPPRRRLELRRAPLRVEVDELDEILNRQVRGFASRALSKPECTALDRSAE